MDEIDLGVSDDNAQSQAATGGEARTAASGGAADREKKRAATSEGADSSSTTCGDIYVQINLQLFFAAAADSQS